MEIAENELRNLEERLNNAKNGLINAISNDEKIEYQFDIMKINETIVIIEEKIRKLKNEKLKVSEHQNANEVKEKLFKKLYVQLSDNEIRVLSEGYGINYDNKDKIIRFLADNYTEKQIYDVLTSYKMLQKEKTRIETTQKKVNRWKRAGWGATQEEMVRWEKARKDKCMTHNGSGGWEKAGQAQAKFKQTKQVQDKTKQVNMEKARIKSEITVVTGEVKYLGDGTYKYTYKTSDGKIGSIYGSSIEDLQIKSRQYKIQWDP